MSIIGIIPARYASTRFPGKPLADVLGKTMIQRVYEQASLAKKLSKVLVATDDERIFNHVKSFGGIVVMTQPTHRNGTERCSEAVDLIEENFEAVINIQGDEPFINPEQIDLLAQCLMETGAEIATLVKKISSDDDLSNPKIAKVVLNKYHQAIYFSRAVIPYHQNTNNNSKGIPNYYKHIGIYGYKTETLKEIVQLQPSPLEIAESLEQLRWLENGYTIQTALTELETFAIDTPSDLEKLHLQHQ